MSSHSEVLLTLKFGFWVCALAVGSTYALYPLVLMALRPLRRPHKTGDDLPSVTLVISAFNEEAVIRQKLENSLALDYPVERLEVMVVSDASDDTTDRIVAEYRDRGVVLCRQEPRQGKSAGLSRFVPQARGEIVVFSDANSMYQPDAVKKLVRHFADPQVGFAVGYQRYVEQHSATCDSESLYWRYETWLKVMESRIGSVVCGDGAIYAIRRELFEPLRPDDINDFYLPLRIVARGFRGIFDQEAMCFEQTADDFAGEFRRKTRIVNRSLRAVTRVPQALNPWRVGRFAFQLAVHKVLRWFVPFFLLGLFLFNALLALQGSLFYQATLALQLACYGTALLWFVPWLRQTRPVYIAFYFCLVNAAAGLGILAFLRGSRFATWKPERKSGGVEEWGSRGVEV